MEYYVISKHGAAREGSANTLLEAVSSVLESEVQVAIANGYTLQGGVSVSTCMEGDTTHVVMAQSLIKGRSKN